MKLSRSYRNPMVKHDPEPHMVKQTICCQIAAKNDQVPFAVHRKGL